MNTKELLTHLYELEHQLNVVNDRIGETIDTFNNQWLSARLSAVRRGICSLKGNIEELEEVYTF